MPSPKQKSKDSETEPLEATESAASDATDASDALRGMACTPSPNPPAPIRACAVRQCAVGALRVVFWLGALCVGAVWCGTLG